MKITEKERHAGLPYSMVEAFERIELLAKAGDCHGALLAATRYKTALSVAIKMSKRRREKND